MLGEGVGRGTLHLYELVGEPYIFVGWGTFIQKNDGQTNDDRGKDVVPNTITGEWHSCHSKNVKLEKSSLETCCWSYFSD